MSFTAQDVMKLRELTGVGMMECKKALVETGGSIEKAAAYLREQGMAVAAKKADRLASEGVVESYIHMGGKMGVMVEVNCESDFVAKSDEFRTLCRDIAMHIAAFEPKYVSSDEVPTDKLDAEKEILRKQALNEGKPIQIVDKMVEGRVKKYYEEVCLLNQAFAKDQSITVQALINNAISKIGEKITVRRFVAYTMGEGLEKKSENLADEVAKMTPKAEAKPAAKKTTATKKPVAKKATPKKK
ncbi:MAG: translation elongation factor Ts [Firmicutes bacterium]|nr:translation elongation factor Ts [Bacillota bacterium]